MKQYAIFTGLAIFSLAMPLATAEDIVSNARPNSHESFIHRDPHPKLMADLAVEFTPSEDYKLEIPSKTEVNLDGLIKVKSGESADPIRIIHRPRVMISSLSKGKPMILYLKKYDSRSAYYIIGIFPVGVE